MRRVSKMYPLIWALVPVFLCVSCAHHAQGVTVPVTVPPAPGPEPTAPTEPSRVVVPPPPPDATPEQIAEYQRQRYDNDLAHERAMIEYRRALADFQRRHDQWETERDDHQAAIVENRNRGFGSVVSERNRHESAAIENQRLRIGRLESDRNRHGAAIAENDSREGGSEFGTVAAVSGGVFLTGLVIGMIVWAAAKSDE